MQKIITLFLLFGTCLLSAQSLRGLTLSSEAKQQPTGKTYALIVGVSRYKNSSIPQLEFADADANAFYHFLTKLKKVPEENIHVLTNENALAKSVESELRNMLVMDSKPGDLVIIYFAGHGDVSRKIANDGFLLQYDANPDGDYYSGSGSVRILLLQKLAEIAALEQVKVLLITDACHSGKIMDANGASNTTLALMQEWQNVLKIVSCGPGESAYEGMQWPNGHGVFTYYLLRGMMGLADDNNDGKIEFHELMEYIHSNVKRDEGGKQLPKWSGDDHAFLFDVDPKLKALAESQQAPEIMTLKNERGLGEENGLPVSARLLLNEFNMSIRQGNLMGMDTAGTARILPFVFDSSLIVSPHKGDISKLIMNPDAMSMAMSGSSKNIWMMDPDTRRIRSILSGHTAKVENMVFSHDGRLLVSCSRDKTVKVWNVSTSEAMATIQTEAIPEICLFNTTDQQVIVAMEDGKIILYDLKGNMIKTLNAHDGKVRAMLLDADGQLISIGQDMKMKEWNIQKFGKPKVYELKGNHISDAMIDRISGELICMDEKGNCIRRGQSPYSTEVSIPSVQPVKPNTAVLYDGQGLMLKAAGNNGINIVDIGSKKVSLMADTKGRNIHAIAVDPLRHAIVYSDQQAKLTFCYLHGMDWSASLLIGEMEKDTALADKLRRAKGTLAMALQNNAQDVIDIILAGSGLYPNVDKSQAAIEAINAAIYYAGADTFYDHVLLCKKLFLEGYDVILRNDRARFEEAKSKFKQIIAIEPNAAYPYVGISAIEQLENDNDAVAGTASLMRTLVPRWSEPYRLLASAQLESGHYDTAEQLYQKIINIYPESSKGYMLLGKEEQQLGFFSSAANSYQTALMNADEDDPAILTNYASLQMIRGSADDAMALIGSAIAVDSSYQLPYQLLGDYFSSQYNYTGMDTFKRKCQEYYQQAVKLAPYDPTTYISLGNFYVHDGLRKKENGEPVTTGRISGDSVSRIFERAIILNPYAIEAYAGLGWCQYVYRDNVDEAIKKFSEAISKKPESSSAYYNLGYFYNEINDTANAVRVLKNAIVKDKKYQNAYIALMSVYAKENAQDSLYKIYEQAAKNCPKILCCHLHWRNMSIKKKTMLKQNAC